LQARKFNGVVKEETFIRINQLTNDLSKSMLDVVDNVCGDQKLEIDPLWFQNVLLFIIRAKIEEINLPEDH
jgi:hypothetical protein